MPELSRKEILTGDSTPDKLKGQKTLYDASYPEIFWKNFTAGLSRALGGIIIYTLFTLGVVGFLFSFLRPVIEPMLEQLSTILSTFQKIPQF